MDYEGLSRLTGLKTKWCGPANVTSGKWNQENVARHMDIHSPARPGTREQPLEDTNCFHRSLANSWARSCSSKLSPLESSMRAAICLKAEEMLKALASHSLLCRAEGLMEGRHLGSTPKGRPGSWHGRATAKEWSMCPSVRREREFPHT